MRKRDLNDPDDIAWFTDDFKEFLELAKKEGWEIKDLKEGNEYYYFTIKGEKFQFWKDAHKKGAAQWNIVWIKNQLAMTAKIRALQSQQK